MCVYKGSKYLQIQAHVKELASFNRQVICKRKTLQIFNTAKIIRAVQTHSYKRSSTITQWTSYRATLPSSSLHFCSFTTNICLHNVIPLCSCLALILFRLQPATGLFGLVLFCAGIIATFDKVSLVQVQAQVNL